MIARFHRSVVGDVSLMVTGVPFVGVAAFCRWTQYVSPAGARNWSTSVWFAPGVWEIGLDQSVPTPHTQDPALVVVRVAVGAPEETFVPSVDPGVVSAPR